MTIAYLTIEQAAERAQVSRNTVKKWLKEGLPCIVLSKRLKRIRTIDFDDWLTLKIEGTTSSQVMSGSARGIDYFIERIAKERS